jgi:hypothetical protein
MNLQRQILKDFNLLPEYQYIDDDNISYKILEHIYRFSIKENIINFYYKDKKFIINCDKYTIKSIIEMQIRNINKLYNIPFEFIVFKNDDVICSNVFVNIKECNKSKSIYKMYHDMLKFGITDELIKTVEKEGMLDSFNLIIKAYIGYELCVPKKKI